MNASQFLTFVGEKLDPSDPRQAALQRTLAELVSVPGTETYRDEDVAALWECGQNAAEGGRDPQAVHARGETLSQLLALGKLRPVGADLPRQAARLAEMWAAHCAALSDGRHQAMAATLRLEAAACSATWVEIEMGMPALRAVGWALVAAQHDQEPNRILEAAASVAGASCAAAVRWVLGMLGR